MLNLPIPSELLGFPRRDADSAGGISPEYQPPIYSKDDRPLITASRSGLLSFSSLSSSSSSNNQSLLRSQQQHGKQQDYYLNLFRKSPRLGATIAEQLGEEADARLGQPGNRIRFGLSLGLCKVYAEVGSISIAFKQGDGALAEMRFGG